MEEQDDNLVFLPCKSDRLMGKNKTSFRITVILFYSLILTSLGVLIYTLAVPGASVWDSFMYPFFYPLVAAATLYAANRLPLPFLSKSEKLEDLQYHLAEKELLIKFFGKVKMSVPYNSILNAEKLPEPIDKTGAVQTRGKYFWIAEQAIGINDDYGALYVFSSSLSKGVLLQRKFEKILVSPEKEEEFIAEIKRRAGEVGSKKTAVAKNSL